MAIYNFCQVGLGCRVHLDQDAFYIQAQPEKKTGSSQNNWYQMQKKHIVEPLFVSHCILVQHCFLSFVSIILRHVSGTPRAKQFNLISRSRGNKQQKSINMIIQFPLSVSSTSLSSWILTSRK